MNYPPAKDRRVSCTTGASEVSCFNWPLLFRSRGRSSTGGSSARRSGNSTAVSPVRGVPSLFRILIPSSRILQAAFGSRSMTAPQCGHTHTRSLSLSSLYMPPQWLHIFELGKNLPILTTVLPYHAALYSIIPISLPSAWSCKAAARLWFFCMPFMLRVSRHITS